MRKDKRNCLNEKTFEAWIHIHINERFIKISFLLHSKRFSWVGLIYTLQPKMA